MIKATLNKKKNEIRGSIDGTENELLQELQAIVKGLLKVGIEEWDILKAVEKEFKVVYTNPAISFDVPKEIISDFLKGETKKC